MGTTHFSGWFLLNSRHLITPQPRGLFLSYFFFEKSPSNLNVCEKYWLTGVGELCIRSTTPGMNTVNQNSDRKILTKSSENQRLFPESNLTLRPVSEGLPKSREKWGGGNWATTRPTLRPTPRLTPWSLTPAPTTAPTPTTTLKYTPSSSDGLSLFWFCDFWFVTLPYS